MQRTVSATLELTVVRRADLVLAVTAADAYRRAGLLTETLTVTRDGVALDAVELADAHGTRLHHLAVDAGDLIVHYDAEVTGHADPKPASDLDLVTYLRPSRYCESDTLLPTARSEFRGLSGKDLLDAVSSWVGDKLVYVSGSSKPTDGALSTLLARQGVCRDYAHLVIALLRALDVPARLAAVYAPGLDPMDFHAVAEAWVDDAWQVVDATTLAPRQTLVRIATGRDAADTAFLTTTLGPVTLRSMQVSAVADALPRDDVRDTVRIR